MKLKILSPSGVILDKQTDLVTLPGGAGSFTIMHNHAPIISTLVKGSVIYKAGDQMVLIEIDAGVVQVENNTIKVYVQ